MRIVFALILSITLFLSDSAVRLILVLRTPHLAQLVIPAERSKLTSHMNYDGYFVTEDYDGTLYHVHDNLRRVVRQPVVYIHTIWIFGNSGAFGLYVSDADTMESRLQAMLPQYRIVNAAAPGEYIAGEYAKLRTMPIKAGDIVVFDDGGMDLVYDRCTDNRFAVLQLLCQVTYQPQPDDYNRIAQQAQAYAASRGASFVHVLQPTPYPEYERGAEGTRLYVPNEYLMDAYHLTPQGEQIEARELYNVLFQLL